MAMSLVGEPKLLFNFPRLHKIFCKHKEHSLWWCLNQKKQCKNS